jgi:hypothetical protein
MYTSKNDEFVVNDATWRAWIQKGKLRERAGARRGRLLRRIVLAILAGIAIYFIAIRQGAQMLA